VTELLDVAPATTEEPARNGLTVSVVVCAYTVDRWDDIVVGVAGLAAQTRHPDEVILVVDHSPELFARCRDEFPGLTVLENSEERGLSGARNTGVAASTADVVLFLDDDARPASGWVERSLQVFADPDVVGVGGHAEPAWDAPGRPVWFPETFLWVVGCSYEGLPGDGEAIRNPIGAAMGFRRADLLGAAGFTSGIGRVGRHPVGCEETELSIRVRQRREGGARILLSREAVVHHRVREDRATISYFLRRCFWEGYSKAVVAAAVGPQDALSSERSYASRTLPVAVLNGFKDSWRQRRVDGAQQAAAIVAGFVTTGTGYVYGNLTRTRTDRSGGRKR
jgi:glycosyltransferase involved in cell wall biosynthesis